MTRCARAACAAAVVLAVAVGSAGAEECAEGLEELAAWYRIETLHRKIRDAEVVHEWRDASGNGHHLADDGTGLPAVFRTLALNGRPVMEFGKADGYSVVEPFELDDHTIFLVYAAARPSALVQSRAKGQNSFGIVLREGDATDHFQRGLEKLPYNRDSPLEGRFSITVLGREAGHLRSFINGLDVSSNVACDEPLRVGRFFRLSRTRAVKLYAEGLRVAEMIFFDRFLDDDERQRLTECLSEKYAIELADPIVAAPPEVVYADEPALVLSTTSDRDLNGAELVAVEWNVLRRRESPFRHDAASDPTRIHCTVDGTQMRVELTLPLRPAAAVSGVRVLLLKNYLEYVPPEARPVEAGDGITMRLETELTLNAGDFVEVVAVRATPGTPLRPVPEEAELTFRLATTPAHAP